VVMANGLHLGILLRGMNIFVVHFTIIPCTKQII